MLLYLLWKNSDYTLLEIGEHFNVGYTAVGNARVRGECHLSQDRESKRRLEALL